MAQTEHFPAQYPWLALRLTTGLSQREAERRLGWAKDGKGHGQLSLIERGVAPTPEQAAQLRALYLRYSEITESEQRVLDGNR